MTSKIKINQFKWLAALLLLVAAMVMPSTAWAWEVDSHEPGGDGTSSDPYRICTAADLKWFAGLVNGDRSVCIGDITQNTAACAVLTADIEVSEPWDPIMYYEGTFDGKGQTISGLNLSESKNCLFAQNSGTIKNLGVVNAAIAGGSNGSICKTNSGTMEKCFFMATTKSSEGATMPNGAVCQTNNGTITRCYYLASNEDSNGGKTAEQFGSGEVCYLLNDGMTDGTQTWYQNIDNGANDAYPVIDKTHGKVYQCTPCTGVYSNTENNEADHSFEGNDNGFCDYCGAYDIPTPEGSDTYIIENAGQLYWFAAYVNGTLDGNKHLGACAKLTNDITINDQVLKSDGSLADGASNFKKWTPIGTLQEAYYGTFDGDGHTISGLYFNDANSQYVGLFGNSYGTIKNVGIVDSYFNGHISVGGVCGKNGKTIENCYSASTVLGTDFVGGVCGELEGYNGIIKNCYNTGAVSCDKSVGGVCGHNNVGTITNCYYLSGTATSGIGEAADTSGSAEVKTTDDFASGEVCYLLNGKKSEGAEENPLAWYQNINGDSYPVLDSSHGTVFQCTPCTGVYSNAEDTQKDHTYPTEFDVNGFKQCSHCEATQYQPATLNASGEYEIGNAGQLYWFAGLVNGTLSGVVQNQSACAVLTQDITVNSGVLQSEGSLAANASGFTAWTPIGTQENPYSCTFDGNGHTISGLYFNDESKAYVGLFGKSNGTIKNIGVVNSYFNGYCIVGAVCGENNGTIQNCYNNSTVNGTKSIGGICGFIDSQGKILNCYNVSKVNGSENIGGVCGNNNNGTITNCYNNSTVRGTEYIGGICGIIYSQGKILNCYNVGVISNVTKAGGVCGFNQSATITNCYYLSGTATRGIAYEDDTPGSAEVKTTEQFGSGEVAYLLNGSSPYGEWGQQIYTNDYPVLGSAYKVLRAARDGGNGTNYWATFSNLNSNAELTAPTGNVTVYNATVSGGKLTLTKRSDNRVAMEEGVLLKANCEYVNAKNISDEVSAATTGENHLVATPAEAKTITADDNYTLYRLTYNKVSDYVGLGFYLSLIKDENDEVDQSSVGKQLAATPGKAYLNVLTSDAKLQSSAAPARGFAFPGNDGETTGIECISVTDESSHRNGNAEGIFDLQGRKVSKPTKGVYINNGKKVIIK